jgi:ubiquinone/menaquinone biosynthesis C-methylase UbiE
MSEGDDALVGGSPSRGPDAVGPYRVERSMDQQICRQQVIMPGGIELTREAEPYLDLGPSTTVLSVACGTGELELYLAHKYACQLIGIDLSEGFVRQARKKAAARGLDHLARFRIGDGSTLEFEDATFDVVFCSGALCAFFGKGLCEFHRVVKAGGRCAIMDVLWRHERVPPEVVQRWAGGTAHILTLAGNCEAFEQHRFRVLLAREYHKPSWWEAYYQDRGHASNWIEERDNYRRDQEHLGVGLFCLEKEGEHNGEQAAQLGSGHHSGRSTAVGKKI